MPFNPINGNMHRDHGQLLDVISEYGKAMEALGRAGGRPMFNPATGEFLSQSPEHQSACEHWGNVLDCLRDHFCKHWFNAVG